MSTEKKIFFLPIEPRQSQVGGQRLCLFHVPPGSEVRGAVLYVHPWAEEINKSRRMAALQSRALAEAGYAVLQIDLYGCGDSSGEFGDAGWSDWIDDLDVAAHWLNHRYPDVPFWLWGLRAGALLAVEAAARMPWACNFLFWQPSTRGNLVLQQFLRLEMAGALHQGGNRGVVGALRKQLSDGHEVEVAGYSVSARLAGGLERCVLHPPRDAAPPAGTRVEWLEVSSRVAAGADHDYTMTASSSAVLDRWRAAGYLVRFQAVGGPSFWQTTEVEEAPELLRATLTSLDDVSTPGVECTPAAETI